MRNFITISRSSVLALGLTYGGLAGGACASPQSQEVAMAGENVGEQNLAQVRGFIAALVAGDAVDAASRLTEDSIIVFGRAEPSDQNPLYGEWSGRTSASEIIALFQELIIPGEVNVHMSRADSEFVIIQGDLLHEAKKTGKPFKSDWVLVATMKDGLISKYHFFEDTAALEWSLRAD